MSEDNSAIGEAWTSVGSVPMEWSLGVIGDLLWVEFPDLREKIRDLICERIQASIDLDQELEVLQGHYFLTDVVQPWASESPPNVVKIERLCRLLRRLWTYRGPGWIDVHNNADLYLIEWMDLPEIVGICERVDPELVAYVRRRPEVWRG